MRNRPRLLARTQVRRSKESKDSKRGILDAVKNEPRVADVECCRAGAERLLERERGHLLIFIGSDFGGLRLAAGSDCCFRECDFGGVQDNRRGRLEDSDCNRFVAREIFLVEVYLDRQLIVFGRGKLRKPLGAGSWHERQNECNER